MLFWRIAGMVLSLSGIGLLGPLILEAWRRSPARSASAASGTKEESLERALLSRAEADHSDRVRMLAKVGSATLLVGAGLIWIANAGAGASLGVQPIDPTVHPGTMQVFFGSGSAGGGWSFGSGSAGSGWSWGEEPTSAAPSILSGLFIANCVLLAAGVLLLLFGHGKSAKAAGLVSIAGGLIGHGYLIKDFKIDKVFGIDKFLSLHDPRLSAEIRRAVSDTLGPSGLELIGTFPHFERGSAELKLTDFDADAEANGLCAVWQTHRDRGQDGVLVIVGATDRLPLRAKLAAQYDANAGLARARAERVKRRLLECINSPASRHPIDSRKILTLISGPATTSEATEHGQVSLAGYPDDRRVDVWAFWTSEKKE